MAKRDAHELVVKIVTYLLLFFIVFSLGFALGKEFALRGVNSGQLPISERNGLTVVYYLRSTFRCWQCNVIELYTDELIKREFAGYIESGTLEWRVVDYLQERELANRYNISGNTVIVTSYQDGREISHTRLDQVMEKVFNQEEFRSYVREAIERQLNIQS